MVARTNREVLRWHESLYLTYPIIVPKWDLANGYAYAEILHAYFPTEINMLTFINGRSLNSRLSNWAIIKQFLTKKNLSISTEFIDATLHGKDGGAERLLEETYELFTNKKPFIDVSYERDNNFTDHSYQQSLNYYQRSHGSQSIKNNVKISELRTDPSYAHWTKKNENILKQLKVDRQKIRLNNPRRFDLKPTLAERCLREPLQSDLNAQDWYMNSFVSRSRSATNKTNGSNQQSSRQVSADVLRKTSNSQHHRGKGIIQPNEDNALYKEMIIKQHSIPLSDLTQTSTA